MTAKRVPTRSIPREEYLGRWNKALERKAAMERELAAGATDPALLLAVQAAIAASDALAIFHRGECTSAERHEDALAVLTRLTHLPGIKEAARHLAYLLRVKGEIEYTGRALRSREAESLVMHARRFLDFASKHLP